MCNAICPKHKDKCLSTHGRASRDWPHYHYIGNTLKECQFELKVKLN